MTRALSISFILALAASSGRPARACKCAVSYSACNEVAMSDLVFVGTVESIDPISLNLWNMTSPASLKQFNNAYTDAQAGDSTSALDRFKDTYRKAFPDLAADSKHQVQDAKTASDVASLFYFSLYRGMRVRFKVKTLFKRGDGDDDPKDAGGKSNQAKDDDAPKKAGAKSQQAKDLDEKMDDEFLDVWTPFGDCGYSFQVGETYLVYASEEDEGSNEYATGSCTRTRRLSDAGGDLAYLFFYKDRPEESARLEGFTSSDLSYQLRLDPMHDPQSIQSPVPGVIVALQSNGLTRYAESDRNGRFIFDGLPKGDYKVSAFPHEYPLKTQLLAGPQSFHLDEKSCGRQVLLVPGLGIQ